jgi:GH43 family beta-xylosidase
MTKQEIKTELENVIYVLETLENDYAALKLKVVLSALEQDWNESAYFTNEIDTILNYEQTMNNLNDITIYE